jgi:hypothetical protein
MTGIVTSLYQAGVPKPLSLAEAFYAFDGNLLDLYIRYNGEIIGRSISYVQGYVAYGKALVLNQSIPTHINISPAIAIDAISSFTIEGYFMLQKTQMNSTLVQLRPNISMNLINGVLSVMLTSNIDLSGSSVISTDTWHHISFVYDATQLTATISIDGIVDATKSSIKLTIPSTNADLKMIVGAGFEGYIDQLSISLQAKTQREILWDATTVAYYPLDIAWSLDLGPNGINASASKVISVYGWRYNALKFNASGARYETDRLTALGRPYQAFSIALWIRAETQAGVFLTVSNPYTCLLVLGLQNNDNRLVVYLPNGSVTGESVNIIGPMMPTAAWVHVAFTWSTGNRARLYTSGYLQASNSDASILNTVRGGNNSSPMTITLGDYNGAANCQGIQGINTSQQFMGSLDELFVFASELQNIDLLKLLTPG